MAQGPIRKFLTRLVGFLAPRRWKRGDIRECVTVLPVLRAQITEAAQQVEAAVGRVCSSFEGIADRSRETVERATGMLGSEQGGGATVEESVATSRATISGLLERLERAGEISSMAIAHMQEIDESVRGMESLLGEVQRIAFTNKLIALNAKIEAVHVGELGAGFEVVAEEISRQAAQTHELTEGIAKRIQETRDRAHSAAGSLRGFVEEDRAQSEASRRNAEAALQVLFSVHQRARDSVAMMTSESSRLRDEVSQATVDLQFQDRFSQRVAHVVEVLETVEGMLSAADRGAVVTRAHGGGSLLEGAQAAYTMHDERQVQARVGSVVAIPSSGGMDVELF